MKPTNIEATLAKIAKRTVNHYIGTLNLILNEASAPNPTIEMQDGMHKLLKEVLSGLFCDKAALEKSSPTKDSLK